MENISILVALLMAILCRTITIGQACDVNSACYPCSGSSENTLDIDLVCNGQVDCPEADDEANCDITFVCEPGIEIAARKVCNGYSDCLLGTDEINCTHCSNTDYFYECPVSKLCIRLEQMCDGYMNCEDGSDEIDCTCDETYQFTCGDGSCVLTDVLCDGGQDCPGGEDEQNCGDQCMDDQFTCLDYKSCINAKLRCDGNIDCQEGSDEYRCVSLDESSDALLVTTQGLTYPVCSTDWDENWNDLACQEMGYGSAVSSGRISQTSVSSLSTNGFLFPRSRDDPTSIIDVFITSNSSCEGMVVTIACNYDACGSRNRESQSDGRKLVGGVDAKAGIWPWQIGLVKEGEGHMCGGSLIHHDWVLTAAHCLEDDPEMPNLFSVRLGSTKATGEDPNLQTITVADIHIHEGYDNSTFVNDIALLQLSQSMHSTAFIKPICLPDETETFAKPEFVECFVTGWGGLDKFAIYFPTRLQQLKMDLVDDDTCASDTDIRNMGLFEPETMICAGYNHNHATICNGDSGGPLVCRSASTNRWTQAGVVSWGPVDEEQGIHCKGYSVFARVTHFKPWIDEMIKQAPEITTPKKDVKTISGATTLSNLPAQIIMVALLGLMYI